MNENVLNVIKFLIDTGIAAFVIKFVGTKLVELIEAKKDQIAQNVLVQKATQIWWQVEETFRTTVDLTSLEEDKEEMFSRLMTALDSSLTAEEIETLKQSISGVINKGKKAVSDVASAVKENQELKAKNAELEAQLTTVTAAVTTASQVASNNTVVESSDTETKTEEQA